MIAYFGGDETTHKATTAAVSAHNASIATQPATSQEGEVQVRAAAQFLSDRLDNLEWMDDDLEATLRDYMGHVDPAHARLRSALAATPTPPTLSEDLRALIVVTDAKGFVTLHEPDEDGNAGDLVASVWRDDWLPALTQANAS